MKNHPKLKAYLIFSVPLLAFVALGAFLLYINSAQPALPGGLDIWMWVVAGVQLLLLMVALYIYYKHIYKKPRA